MHLETERLWLVDLTLDLMRRRVTEDDFEASVDTPQGAQRVRFPPAWPGGLLPMFPELVRTSRTLPWNAVLVRRADRVAVGAMGVKGTPDAAGDWEVGYGLNPDVWNQGLATEALSALLPLLRAQPGVRRITAETAVTNPASARVLTKCGFEQVGTGHSRQHGDLLLWATRA